MSGMMLTIAGAMFGVPIVIMLITTLIIGDTPSWMLSIGGWFMALGVILGSIGVFIGIKGG